MGGEDDDAGSDYVHRSWGDSWEDFTQNTTMHGFRYIFDPTPFKIRRLLWILVVIGCFMAATSQIIMQVMYLLSDPEAANIKVVYKDMLPFPAITICNQNQFRVSATGATPLPGNPNMTYYDLINIIYGEKYPEAEQLEEWGVADKTFHDLYEVGNHLKDNMLITCKMGRKVCSIANFTRIITDHGVCFTFNTMLDEGGNKIEDAELIPIEVHDTDAAAAAKKERLAAHFSDAFPSRGKVFSHETGIAEGLKLQINVEQYEYMRGPHDSAGLKILIHDPYEFPQVGDLGEAVAPETVTLVGLRLLEMWARDSKCQRNGQLDYFDHYTKVTCKLDCKTQFLVRRCGCKEAHVPGLRLNATTYNASFVSYSTNIGSTHENSSIFEDVPYCNLSAQLHCIPKASDEFQLWKTNETHQEECEKRYVQIKDGYEVEPLPEGDFCCFCPDACKTKNFDPVMSYSDTSNFNLERLLKMKKVKQLQYELTKARESKDSTDVDTKERDTNAFRNLYLVLEYILSVLHRIDGELQELMEYFLQRKEEMESLHEVQMKGIRDMRRRFKSQFFKGVELFHERHFSSLTWGYREMLESLENQRKELVNFDQINETFKRTIFTLASSYYEITLQGRVDVYHRVMVKLEECFNHYNETTPFSELDDPRERDMPLPVTYIKAAADRENYKEIKRYLKKYRRGIEGFKKYFSQLFKDQIMDQEYLTNRERLKDACENLERLMAEMEEIYRQPEEKLTKDEIELERVFQESKESFERIEEDIDSLVDRLRHIPQREMEYAMNVARLFLNQTKTKSDLSEIIIGDDMRNALESLKEYLNDMEISSKKLLINFEVLQRGMQEFWKAISANEDYRKLHSADKSASLRAFTEFKQRLAALSAMRKELGPSKVVIEPHRYSDDSGGVIENIHVRLGDMTEELQGYEGDSESNSSAIDVFASVLETGRKIMDKFVSGNQITTSFLKDNFLSIYFFYRELNYQIIESQGAYGLKDLACDIGGAMGLFVGASVITAFEVLDLILHNIGIQCKSKRREERKAKKALASAPEDLEGDEGERKSSFPNLYSADSPDAPPPSNHANSHANSHANNAPALDAPPAANDSETAPLKHTPRYYSNHNFDDSNEAIPMYGVPCDDGVPIGVFRNNVANSFMRQNSSIDVGI